MRKVLFIPALSILVPQLAAAQPNPLPPPGQSPAGSSETPVEIPPPPSVNDPMLAPVPPAARNISRWEEALVLLRARSTDLRTAYDQVLQAEAQTRTALAGTLATINGTVTATHNFITNQSSQVVGVDPTTLQPIFRPYTVPTVNYMQGGAQVVQPILALETWHSIGTAKVGEDAARLSLEDMKRTIALNVANALVGVVTAERVAELNRVGFRNALERLDLTQRKRNLGSATGLDVVRAQQDVESARATLVSGDEALLEAREALGLALGLPQQIGVTRDLRIDGLEQDALNACRVARSVDERADIAALRSKVDIARRNVDDVYYQFLPTLNAQSTVGTTTLDTGAAPNTTWNIQGVLSIPLWDGGLRYGSLRNNRALEDEAVQALEAARRQAEIQVVQARRGVSVAEKARKVAADARALAAETDRLTRVGYLSGQGTSLDLVVAAAALRQADITLALREFDLVKARILAIMALATCPW